MAHTKPLGTHCKLYYDSPRDVQEGDVVRTSAGSCYRIVGVRRQHRGKHAGRWHLDCVRIGESDVEADDTVHPLHWYSRKRRRKNNPMEEGAS